jgi:hypothetical protein
MGDSTVRACNNVKMISQPLSCYYTKGKVTKSVGISVCITYQHISLSCNLLVLSIKSCAFPGIFTAYCTPTVEQNKSRYAFLNTCY